MIDGLDSHDPVHALIAVGDGTIYAGRRSGLYCSHDAAVSWRPLIGGSEAPLPAEVTAVAAAPGDTAQATLFAGGQGGLVRSTDGGVQWRVCMLPPPPPLVTAIAVSPAYAADRVVLAGTAEDGVFRSADRGERWASWNFGLLDLRILALALSPAFAVDETVFAATETGIFRSTNGGRAWREAMIPDCDEPVLCLAISPDYATDGLVYAATETTGLYRSADGGMNWEHVTAVAAGAQPVNAITCISPAEIVVALADRLVLMQGANAGYLRVVAQWPIDGITALTVAPGQAGHRMLVVGDTSGRIQRLMLP